MKLVVDFEFHNLIQKYAFFSSHSDCGGRDIIYGRECFFYVIQFGTTQRKTSLLGGHEKINFVKNLVWSSKCSNVEQGRVNKYILIAIFLFKQKQLSHSKHIAEC